LILPERRNIAIAAFSIIDANFRNDRKVGIPKVETQIVARRWPQPNFTTKAQRSQNLICLSLCLCALVVKKSSTQSSRSL
jgi:hypothetical protein